MAGGRPTIAEQTGLAEDPLPLSAAKQTGWHFPDSLETYWTVTSGSVGTRFPGLRPQRLKRTAVVD